MVLVDIAWRVASNVSHSARVDREKSTTPMHARRGEKRKTFMGTTSEKNALSV
jgi:hypothetical protein